jgi:hypothetical protein
VRKRGLTLQAVEAAMREVLEEKFPGVFIVNGPSPESATVTLQVREREEDDDEFVLVWYDNSDVYPGFIGGKHPRMGTFGYWLLFVIECGIAKKLKTRIFDEGVGYYRAEDEARGVEDDFVEYVKQQRGFAWTREYERKVVPKALWPWFDGAVEQSVQLDSLD